METNMAHQYAAKLGCDDIQPGTVQYYQVHAHGVVCPACIRDSHAWT